MRPADVLLLEVPNPGAVGAGSWVEEVDDWVDSGVPGIFAHCRHRRVAQAVDTGVPGTACA